MIKKITLSEYLKRYDNMDASERQTIAKRVGEWLHSAAKMLLRRAEEPDAQLQNVMQISARWNDDECRAWEDGARLLTAFSNMTDTWLPDRLYGKAAYRSIRRMVKCLKTMGEPDGAKPIVPQGQNVVEQGSGMSHQKHDKGGGASTPYNQVPKGGGGAKPAQTGGTPPKPGNTTVIPRPKHIDQYVHLFPKKTQERAAKYGELMRALEEARENMRLLMNDENASDKSREMWAKTATKIDSQVKSIRKELDTEWEKAVKSGRVTVDDLGQAHVVSSSKVQDSGELTKEQKARVKQLRNALRDTRGPKEPGEKHDAYVKKWVDKYREMVKIGGPGTVTEAVVNSAKLYGIEVKGKM